MLKTTLLSVAAVVALAGSASAQIDGTYKAAYGSPVVYQTIGTHFGDSNSGNIQTANGSELDAAFAYVSGGNLNLLLTGNLESNFNKMVVFFDNGNAGGYNTLVGGVAGLPGTYNGMTLDQAGQNGASATFRATQWLSVTCGGGTFGMFVDGGDLLANNGGYQGGNDGQSGGVLSGGSNSLNALVALNNSNTLGVNGNQGTAQGFNALTATTGVEINIPLASLGVASANGLRVMAFINGQNHDYLSNQFLSPLPVGGLNLGDDGAGNYTGGSLASINMNAAYAPGDQFFTLTPAPGSLGVLALGGLVAARRRRA
jgi:hypothetical protein